MSYKFNPFTGNFDDIGTPGSGSGDMLKSVYDTDNDGVVDIAESMQTKVRNSTGSTLYKGTIVRLSGSTGNRPNAVKAQANNEAGSAQTYGVVFADISNNSDGYVLTEGVIETLDTRSTATNPFTSDTLADGDVLYLDPTTAGYVTNVKPSAPNHMVYVGRVIRTHPTQGAIVYRVQNGYELKEIHDVAASSPTDGQVLTYESSTSLWKPKTATSSLSLTEYNNSDKPSPSAGDVWVKHTTSTVAGSPVGLLLSLTNATSGTEKYELSYRTSAGTTKRVELA